MAQTVYFDESGFTGNNLLHPEQAYFAYGSVATDDNEAKEFVSCLVKKYGIQGDELKGSKLIKFSKGRKAVDEIFNHFEGRLKVSISNKKYALACKFFEYIFEPCVSKNSALFYGVGFHEFIANILYLEFIARGAGAEEIFAEFEEVMRSKNEADLSGIFSASVHPENSPIITQIREFAQCRAADIRAELDSLSGSLTGKWVLDLTHSALFSLLANWGQEFDEMIAVCDPSKPLKENQGLIRSMVGRKDKLYIDTFGKKQAMTFNLAKPIQFMDSKTAYGIQIADALAAASVHAWSTPADEHAKKWRNAISKFGDNGSVLPDLDIVDLSNVDVRRNVLVLMELHSRAVNGQKLLDGFPEYLGLITQALQKPRVW